MMRVVIANDSERENLFAEIHFDDFQWAEITLNDDTGRFLLTLFPPMDREFWTLNLDDALRSIAEARSALEAKGYRERT